MKYKVGDRVVVKEDLNIYDHYYMDDMKSSDFANSLMCAKSGEIVTIISIVKSKYKINNFGYSWTDDMFEGKVEKDVFTKEDLQQGDLIVYRECCQNGVRKVVGNMLCNHVAKTYTDLCRFNNDLTHKAFTTLDIVKVYRPREMYDLSTMNIEDCDLTWKREEPKIELTLKEIAEKFGCDVNRIRIKD